MSGGETKAPSETGAPMTSMVAPNGVFVSVSMTVTLSENWFAT